MVAFKGGAFLELALQSICGSLEGTDANLIIVENGNDAETKEIIDRCTALTMRPIHRIKNELNRGFPAGCNQIFDKFLDSTSGPEDFLTLTHTDVYWPKTLCAAIRRIFIPLKRTVLAPYTTNTEEDSTGTLQECYRRFLELHRQVREFKNSGFYKSIDTLQGELARIFGVANLEELEVFFTQLLTKIKGCPIVPGADNSCYTFSRELLCEVGYFDEIFFPGMGEDSDFTRRLLAAGFTIRKDPEIFCHHWTSLTYVRSGCIDGSNAHDEAMKKLDQTVKEFLAGVDRKCLRRSCKYQECCTFEAVKNKGYCANYQFDPEYIKANKVIAN